MSDIDTNAPQVQEPVQDTSAPVDTSITSTQTEEAPEVTQEQTVAQEATTTEVNAEDTAEKLYAGKYKSPEDMEKAYKELESKFGQTTSEKAELARILNDSLLTPVQTETDNKGYQTDTALDDDDPMVREIDTLKRNQAAQTFVMAHPEADPKAMHDILVNDPVIKQISGHDAKLEYAYLKSQNIAKPKAIEEAQKQATQQAQSKIAEKQIAQVESASKAEQTDEDSELMSKATKGTPQEREAARLAIIRKNLVTL